MPDLSSTYPLVISQDLIWRDMDVYGHINNAVYFRYFEDVRLALFENIGVSDFKRREHLGPILASTRCDFRAPLIYPGRIQIGTCIEDIKAKRFTMKYAVYSEQLDGLAAEGEGLVVYYDYAKGKSCEIPPVLVPELQALHARS